MRTIIAGSRTATFAQVRAAVDDCPFKIDIAHQHNLRVFVWRTDIAERFALEYDAALERSRES